MGSQQSSRIQSTPNLTSAKSTNSELDFIFKRPIFWRPTYIAQSAWLEHIPFAFWLVDSLQPRKIVELGTRYGSSYFSFCQAVTKLDLDTKCYAVNIWSDDKYAEYNGEEVYRQVSEYNHQNYSDISTLVRSTFDQALEHFPQGSIDLLHIDNTYNLETVRQDFESWLPKLSEKAVVIMHDTNVRECGFEVFRLLDELKLKYPHFEFSHGHGLGVIGVGSDQTLDMKGLYGISESARATKGVHEIFSRLGKSCAEIWENIQLKRQLAINKEELLAEHQKLNEKTIQINDIQARALIEKNNTINLMQELEGINQTKNQLQRAYESLESRYDSLSITRNGLQAENTKLHEKFSDASMKQQQLLDQLLAKDKALALINEKNNELTKIATNKEQELTRLQQLQLVLIDDNKSLKRDFDFISEELNESRANLTKSDSENKFFQQQEKTFDAAISQSKDELSKLNFSLNERVSEIAALTQLFNGLEKRNTEIGLENQLLSSTLADLQNQLQTEKMLHQNAQKTLVSISEEKSLSLNELNEKLSERFNEIAILTRSLEEREKLLEYTSIEKQNIHDEYFTCKINWEKEKDHLVKAQAELKERFISLENKSLENQSQLEKHVSVLNCQNEVLESSITERFRELATITRHMEVMSRELQKKEQQLQLAKERANNLKSTVSWKLTAPVRAISRTFKEGTTAKTKSFNAIESIKSSGLFNEVWYKERYPEVTESGLSAIEHFIQVGANKGYSPSELFDAVWYLKTYPDVAQGSINPLIHYIKHGKTEQRQYQALRDNK